MEEIVSSSNKKYKELIKLYKSARFRREMGLFVAEGIKITKEALVLPGKINQIFISEGFSKTEDYKDFMTFIEDKCKGISENYFETIMNSCKILSDSLFNKISETVNPQGIISVCKTSTCDINDFIKDKEGLVLILDDLNDPGNLGTIIRSSLGAGVDGIILSKNSVDVYNPKVIRSTMGAVFKMPLLYTDDLEKDINLLTDNKYEIVVTTLENSVDYYDVDYKGNVGVVIGNEANGVSEKIKNMPLTHVTIPMKNSLESLNAAVAASVIIYEVARQRR